MNPSAWDVERLRLQLRQVMETYPKFTLNAQFEELEHRVGLDKAYSFIVSLFLASIILFVLGGASLVIDLFGFVYPAYCSFKILDAEENNVATTSDLKEARTQWLIYWVVFSVFTVFESISDVLLSFIPFYFFIKLFFLIWCYHPRTQGATTVYAGVIRPYTLGLLGLIGIPTDSAAPVVKSDAYVLSVFMERIDGGSDREYTAGRQLYVSVSVAHPASRKRSGVEGTRFKSQSRPDSGPVDQELILTPLTDAQGTLHISLLWDKGTLGDDVPLGKATVPLESLELNREQSLTVAMAPSSVCLALRLRLTKD